MDINRRKECNMCNLSFNSKKEFLKHSLTSQHLERTRELIDDVDEVSLIYKAEPKTVTNAKTVTSAKTVIKTQSKIDDSIYTRIKSVQPIRENKCKECNETFRKKSPYYPLI